MKSQPIIECGRIGWSRLCALALVTVLAGVQVRQCVAQAAPVNPDSATCLRWVRAAVDHEVAANGDNSKHMFRSRKQNAQGSQTRLFVETSDAMVGMTIAYNDKPLTPEQMEGEQNRLAGLSNSPEQLKRKHAQEQETGQRTVTIVKALPDAFLYDYDGEETGDGGDRMVRLKFRPNPSYQPPSHVEQVLVGMQGILVIDGTAQRIARIDGNLFKEVSFGWGILGHLDPGGHFLVEQRAVKDGGWELSHLSVAFTGKVLLFKSLNIKSDEVFSDFRRVPSTTTFAQGIEMVKAEEFKQAQNGTPEMMKAETGSH
jgi:hypothetical protein